jgi:hypothetical protein
MVVMMILMVIMLMVNRALSFTFHHLRLAARFFAGFVRRLLPIIGRLVVITWHAGRGAVTIADGKNNRRYEDRSAFTGSRLCRRSLVVPQHSAERATFHNVTVRQYVR